MAPDENAQDARHDAAERSLRSLAQGLALDILVAVVLVLATAVGDIEWTPTYWKLLGLTLAKSVIQAGVSYLMRMFVAPRQANGP